MLESRISALRPHLSKLIMDEYLIFISEKNPTQQREYTYVIETNINQIKIILNTQSTPEECIQAILKVRHYYTKESKLAFNTVADRFAKFKSIIKYMHSKNIITQLPSEKLKSSLSRVRKNEVISIKKVILNHIKGGTIADTEFYKEVITRSNKEICDAFVNHYCSYKHRKLHRRPILDFVIHAHKIDNEWFKDPLKLQGALMQYRNEITKNYQRNTAYGRFQNVKNAVSVLMRQGLLPHNTELPDNIHRSTETCRIRNNNPILAKLDLYDKQSLIQNGTSEYLKSIKEEIYINLKILKKTAQNIVYSHYQDFISCEEIISSSSYFDFIHHPNFKLKKTGSRYSTNALSPRTTNRSSNLIAFCHYNLDKVVNKNTGQYISSIKYNSIAKYDIHKYLGLSVITASAMQFLIIEELGINPYSLYSVKISSNNSKKEFVQITDTDSVKLRTVKPRARTIKSKEGEPVTKQLSQLSPEEIDASACLMMAMEMTQRSRYHLKRNDLWLCFTEKTESGLTCPIPSTFQNKFKIIRKIAYDKSNNKELLRATLKNVRYSKSVYIYLNSNGNILKTASYLGNQVKTALIRYIPPYLQEIIYRIKIRNFQNILLYMTISYNSTSIKINEKSISELKELLISAFNSPDVGGPLIERFKQPIKNSTNPDDIYFCLSQNNLEAAIRYIYHGNDDMLKELCQIVIGKVSEGNVMMKQMLRNAHLASKINTKDN